MAQTTVTYWSTKTGSTVVVTACRSRLFANGVGVAEGVGVALDVEVEVVVEVPGALGVDVAVAIWVEVGVVAFGVTVVVALGVGDVLAFGAGEDDAVALGVGVGVDAAAGPATAASERPVVRVIAVRTAKIFFMVFGFSSGRGCSGTRKKHGGTPRVRQMIVGGRSTMGSRGRSPTRGCVTQ
jgi:hypothetical protein